MHKGRVVFGAMDEVVFGRPASEAIVEQLDRLDAKRAFLMVSGTLNRETDEIESSPRDGAALRRHFRGHAAAYAVRGPIAAAEQVRTAGADLIVTVGGGSITDGANKLMTKQEG